MTSFNTDLKLGGQVDEASLTLDKLQLSQSTVNSVVRSYLSPTPVGVGVALEQVLYGQLTRLSLPDYVRLGVL